MNVPADEVASSSCFVGDGVDMVMPSQVTWYCYTLWRTGSQYRACSL